MRRLILILIPILSFFHVADNNQIDWSPTRKLTWDDFRGAPNPVSTNAALTNSVIRIEYSYDGKKFIHAVSCRFNKLLSWGRIKNDYILNHEQKHFDIAEIHARLLHKALENYSVNMKTLNDDVSRIYSKAMEHHTAFQKEYDAQTNHSLDTAYQVMWDNKISDLLKENEKYAGYR
jgi:hypothetical protein